MKITPRPHLLHVFIASVMRSSTTMVTTEPADMNASV